MEKKTMSWSIARLKKEMDKGRIIFDNAVQRGLDWDNARNSLLIHSAIYGYPIPPMFFVRNEEGGYDALDGKQRSNAFASFLEGNFALSVDTPPIFDENGTEYDISGLFFENLPDFAKDLIKDYSIGIYYYDSLTDAEVRELFRRINNGKPLTATELTRVKAISLAAFQRIAKHPAIDKVVTAKGKSRFTDEQIAMQIYAMRYMDAVDFGTKAFRPFIEAAEVTEEQETAICAGLDYVTALLAVLCEEDAENKENARVLRKVKTRTNFVALAYFAMLCIEHGISERDFNGKVWEFFNCSGTSMSESYNNAVGSGSARPDAVNARKEAMQELLNLEV